MDEERLSIGDVGPPLNETESLLIGVLDDVFAAQMEYQADDRFPPPAPPSMVDEVSEAELDRWEKEFIEHRLRHPAPEPRPPLALSELWDRVVPPPPLRVRDASPNDLYFDELAISQRFEEWGPRRDVTSELVASLPGHYLVAIPRGVSRFRCIAVEVSGRWFCTVEPQSNCSVPAADELGRVRIRCLAGRIGHVYLPTRYGKWAIVKDPLGEYDETVVD